MAVYSKCERQKPAERLSFRVDLCDCGVVHLTIGFVTFRLERGAYAELASLMDEALRALEFQARSIVH